MRNDGPTIYDILHVIGQGGQAEVRLLRDRRTQALFAGKFLREHWDPIAREHFKAEALRQLRVAGPHVVAIVDYNFDSDSPFIVLEYLPNGSLAGALKRRGKLPILEALRLTTQIASALSYLHADGVIHRDVKPANVLLAADGRLLLNDLGVGATVTLSGSVTGTRAVGTPGYAAPEQLFGNPMLASDVYAMGVTLVEMVTGSRVLAGNRVPKVILPLVRQFTAPNPFDRPSAYDAYYALMDVIRMHTALEREQRKRMGAAAGAFGFAALLLLLLGE